MGFLVDQGPSENPASSGGMYRKLFENLGFQENFSTRDESRRKLENREGNLRNPHFEMEFGKSWTIEHLRTHMNIP